MPGRSESTSRSRSWLRDTTRGVHHARHGGTTTLVPVDGVELLGHDLHVGALVSICDPSRDVVAEHDTPVSTNRFEHQLCRHDHLVVARDLGGCESSCRSVGVDDDDGVHGFDRGSTAREHRIRRERIAVSVEKHGDDSDHGNDRDQHHPGKPSRSRASRHRLRTVVVGSVA